MEIVAILTCWFFATAEWRTVAFYQDAKGYGFVKDYLTAYDLSQSIRFRKVDGEIICYIPISSGGKNGLHVKDERWKE